MNRQKARQKQLLPTLEAIIAMEGTERDEWDAVERIIPEIESAAKAAISSFQSKSELVKQSDLKKLFDALERIVALVGTERSEWDAVERLIPEMTAIAKKAVASFNGSARPPHRSAGPRSSGA